MLRQSLTFSKKLFLKNYIKKHIFINRPPTPTIFMERCLTCKFFSGKTHLPLCRRVLLVNTQHCIVPPQCKFEKELVYEYCYTVCSKENLCGKDGKLYEKYNEGLNIKPVIPIMKNGQYNEDYLKEYGKYLRLS
jgi:hypothetical protein